MVIKNEKLVDIFFLICWVFVSILYISLLHNSILGRPLFSTIFLVVPSIIFLSIRRPKNWKKLLFGALIFGVIFGFALSFYAESTNAWTTSNYLFNFRLFGESTLEQLLIQGLMALFIFTFYEHFLDDEKNKKFNKKFLYALLLVISATFILIYYSLLNPGWRNIQYSYLLVITIAIIPTIVMVIQHPAMLKKLALLSLFFLFVWFSLHYFDVMYGFVKYFGTYVGWFELFNVRIPLEEILFLMVLYSPTIVAYYEATIDDAK